MRTTSGSSGFRSLEGAQRPCALPGGHIVPPLWRSPSCGSSKARSRFLCRGLLPLLLRVLCPMPFLSPVHNYDVHILGVFFSSRRLSEGLFRLYSRVTLPLPYGLGRALREAAATPMYDCTIHYMTS